MEPESSCDVRKGLCDSTGWAVGGHRWGCDITEFVVCGHQAATASMRGLCDITDQAVTSLSGL